MLGGPGREKKNIVARKKKVIEFFCLKWFGGTNEGELGRGDNWN